MGYSLPFKTKPFMIVIHWTASPFSTTLDDLSNFFKVRTVSSHFGVDKDGRIQQFVPLNYQANHAGVSAYNLVLQDRSVRLQNINQYSIGIELIHPGVDSYNRYVPFPLPQLQGLITLLQYLRKIYGPMLIVGHDKVAPGRKIDPGPLFPYYAIAQASGLLLGDVIATSEVAELNKKFRLYMEFLRFNETRSNPYAVNRKSGAIGLYQQIPRFLPNPSEQSALLLSLKLDEETAKWIQESIFINQFIRFIHNDMMSSLTIASTRERLEYIKEQCHHLGAADLSNIEKLILSFDGIYGRGYASHLDFNEPRFSNLMRIVASIRK